MQTQYPLFEVIAVNDGSNDKTTEILDELAAQYPKLRVVHLAENQGKTMPCEQEQWSANMNFWCVLMVMPYCTRMQYSG